MKLYPKIVFTIIILFLPFFYSTITEAKRKPPKKVKPVLHNGIKYTAPNKYKQIGNAQIGYVEAWDLESGKKLWEKNIYHVPIKPIMEADVQWIFITELSIEDGNLVVTNEHDEKYILNLETGKVSKYNSRLKLGLLIVTMVLFIFAIGIVFYLKFTKKQNKK
jgi:hypothetical protein